MGVYTRFDLAKYQCERSEHPVSGEEIQALIELHDEQTGEDQPTLLERIAQNTGQYCVSASEESKCGMSFSFDYACDYSGERYDLDVSCQGAEPGEKTTCDHCKTTRTEGAAGCMISGGENEQQPGSPQP